MLRLSHTICNHIFYRYSGPLVQFQKVLHSISVRVMFLKIALQLSRCIISKLDKQRLLALPMLVQDNKTDCCHGYPSPEASMLNIKMTLKVYICNSRHKLCQT